MLGVGSPNMLLHRTITFFLLKTLALAKNFCGALERIARASLRPSGLKQAEAWQQLIAFSSVIEVLRKLRQIDRRRLHQKAIQLSRGWRK